jgi:fructuronate reductase
MADPHFAAFARRLMDESAPTLTMPAGTDLATYCALLLQRFSNTALQHRTWQIAMDGSQKLPQRLLHTIRDRIAAGGPYARLALGVAAWMRYARGIDEAGRDIDVRDPLAARISGAVRQLNEPVAIVDAYLGITDVFGNDLLVDNAFRDQIVAALSGLLERGSAATLKSFEKSRN